MEIKMTRRSFIGFFLLGGFISILFKKFKAGKNGKKAMYWRKTDEV